MDKISCQLLIQIAQTGTITEAAERLNMQKAHASRLLSRLERHLGVRLIERSTRSLRFTEVGQNVLERARHIIDSFEEAEQLARQYQSEPMEQLKLSCSVEFGQLTVNRWIQAYLIRYPKVSIHADFSHRLVDIIEEGFDLAIRVGPLSDSSLSARRLGFIEYGLFASRSYVLAHGMPTTVGELSAHPLLVHTNNQGKPLPWGWQTGHDVMPQGRLYINNSFGVYQAACAGLGIARLPLLMIESMGAADLVRVLPDEPMQSMPVHAVFMGQRLLSPKVRAFIDLAVEMFVS